MSPAIARVSSGFATSASKLVEYSERSWRARAGGVLSSRTNRVLFSTLIFLTELNKSLAAVHRRLASENGLPTCTGNE